MQKKCEREISAEEDEGETAKRKRERRRQGEIFLLTSNETDIVTEGWTMPEI